MDWEEVTSEATDGTRMRSYRARVPGGWIYRFCDNYTTRNGAGYSNEHYHWNTQYVLDPAEWLQTEEEPEEKGDLQ